MTHTFVNVPAKSSIKLFVIKTVKWTYFDNNVYIYTLVR